MMKESKFFLKRTFPFSEGRESFRKGRRNENRAWGLFGELAGQGVFLRVRRASKKQNMQGIDFIGVIDLGEGELGVTREIQIPFQVKSSLAQAREFLKKHGDKLPMGIQVIVVNDFRTDSQVKGDIKNKVHNILRNNETGSKGT